MEGRWGVELSCEDFLRARDEGVRRYRWNRGRGYRSAFPRGSVLEERLRFEGRAVAGELACEAVLNREFGGGFRWSGGDSFSAPDVEGRGLLIEVKQTDVGHGRLAVPCKNVEEGGMGGSVYVLVVGFGNDELREREFELRGWVRGEDARVVGIRLAMHSMECWWVDQASLLGMEDLGREMSRLEVGGGQ